MVVSEQDLVAELESRGLVNQLAGGQELVEHLKSGCRSVYCGFDPTADSLHIGSLVPLLALRRFQLAGHRPLVLVGGATGLIGDPSFKSEERKLNSPDVVASWVKRLQAQASGFIDFDQGGSGAVMVNNYDWVSGLSVLEFLRDIGKHFSVNSMISKESVRQRIDREGSGISFTEFTYMLLQAYDFSELFKAYGCTVQLGGSDQWGNITAGMDLTRRLYSERVYGMTFPLVTKADGGKFGKTEAGTVWLDPLRTTPYEFYQFWVNSSDEDVYKFLKYFTFISVSEIAQIEREDANSRGRRSAQSILAREVTRIVHGQSGLDSAERISEALFSGDPGRLTEGDFIQMTRQGALPVFSPVQNGRVSLLDALVGTGLAMTPRGDVTVGQARKFISEGAVQVNGLKIVDIDAELLQVEAMLGRYHLIRRGKKQFALIVWE
jgi:tyrosyl-tRNA synthetase